MKRSQRLLIPALLGLLVALLLESLRPSARSEAAPASAAMNPRYAPRTLAALAALLILSNPAQAQEWAWAHRYGGNDTEEHNELAASPRGELYGVGTFAGTTTFGPHSLTSNGGSDAYVVRYGPEGEVLWLRAVTGPGGPPYPELLLEAAAADGVVVAGRFDVTAVVGAVTLTSMGLYDVLIVKYSADGDVLWVIGGGGPGEDSAINVALDAAGNAYVVGWFEGRATLGDVTLTSTGHYDGFLAKISPVGEVLWAVNVGGTFADDGLIAVAAAPDGDVLVGGYFRGPIAVGGSTVTSTGDTDGLLARFGPDGQPRWAVNAAGGGGEDNVGDVKLDAEGNIYVTGFFNATATVGPFSITSAGSRDVYVSKYVAAGSVVWVRRAGGAARDDVMEMVVNADGSSVVSGAFRETADFGPFDLTSAGDTDAFVAGYTSNGDVIFADRVGGPAADDAWGLALSDAGLYAGGGFGGTVTFGSATLTSAGGLDVFVAAYVPPPVANEPVPERSHVALAVHPNPSSGMTLIRYVVPEGEVARLALYDGLGREVAVLAEGARGAGEHEVTFDPSGFPSGLYVLRLSTEHGTTTRRLTVVR